MTKSKKLIRDFVFYQGYMEDQALAGLIVSHETGFETPFEAVSAFLKPLRSVFDADANEKLRNCCKGRTTDFCPDCGRCLKQDASVDAEHFANAVAGFFSGTIDGTYEMTQSLENDGWLLWESPGADVCIVSGIDVLAEEFYTGDMDEDSVDTYLQKSNS